MDRRWTVIETAIIDAALTQSIWAALSLSLIFYILKKQEDRDKVQAEREDKYQEIIKKLTDKLEVLEDLKEKVEELKNEVVKQKGI